MTNNQSGKLPPLPPPLQPPTDKGEQQTTDKPKPPQSATARKATAERFGVLNEFVDCSLQGLTKAELLVWLVLYRDTRDGTARTGQTDIARRGGVSVRAVQYAVSKLEKRGLLKCVYRGRLGTGPSRYQVLPTGSAPEAPPK